MKRGKKEKKQNGKKEIRINIEAKRNSFFVRYYILSLFPAR